MSSKYRGAVVEDLQLAPAFCLPAEAPLSAALEAAYEQEFDQLPVLGKNRKPLGYLDVPAIKAKFEQGVLKEDEPIRTYTTLFRTPKKTSSPPLATGTDSKESTPTPASSSIPTDYQTIHPLTPLETLEAFLTKNEFALVTDEGRKWVLGVATRSDLETFVKRRG